MYVIPKLRVNKFVDVPIKSCSEIWNQYRGQLKALPTPGSDVELPPLFQRKTDAFSRVAAMDAEDYQRENATVPSE